ncbi:hypothetical protein NLJ89_g4175 [Agrocybe chaxingu]|uniref:Uncharacterized protein n=1 Tax=Agrocybe chaxingu TaxID=84603 RepID=A0A9W8K114_9AGAR|nr:hypothetical protein NLJ89_g4175 [Agrocybe chaxingu]
MASVPPGSHPGPPSPSTRTTPAKRKRPNFGTPWDLGYHLPKSHKGDNGQLEIRQSPPPILGGTTARERRKSRSGFTRRSATFGVHIHPVRGEGSVNDARATGMSGAGPSQSMPRPTIMVPRPVSSSSFSMQPNEPFLPHVLSSDALMVSPDILIVDPPALPVTSSYTSFDGVLEDPSGTPGGQELTQGPSPPTAGFANSVPTDALRMEPWQVLGNSYQSQASQPPPGQPSAHQQHSPCSRSSTTESLSTNYAFPQAETPLPTVGFHSTSATIRETVKDASGAARGHELSQGPSPPLGSANSIPTEPGQVSGSFSQWQASEPAPGPTHQQYSSSFHSSTTETHPPPSISIRSPSSNILTDTETEQMSGGSSQRQAPEPISSLAHQQCYPLASHPSTAETHSFNETAEDTSGPNRGYEFSRGPSPPLLGTDHHAAPFFSDNVLTDVHLSEAEQIYGDSSQWRASEPTPAAFSGSRLYMPSLPASKTPPDAFRIEQQHVPEGFFPPSSGMQGRPTNAQAHPLYAANRATPVSTAAMRLSRQPLSASVTQHPVAPDTCRVASTANIAGVGIHSSMGQVSSSAGINPPNLTPLSPSISPSRYNSYAGSLSNQQADPGNPYFTSQQFQTAPPSVALYTDVDSRQRLPASGTAASLYPAAPAQLLADRQNENNDRGYEEVYPNSGDRLPPSQNLVQLFDERFDALGRLFRDSERQRQQELDSLSSQVGDLRRRVGAVRGPPPTARPRKKLDAQDERLKHPFRKQFLTNLRRHLHFLLNIKDKSQLCLITPLTREEINAFNLRLPTAIRITTTNWKYDFCQADGTPFNLEAIQVFVDHFLQCINAGWYSHPEPTPDNFKDREFVQDSLERQLYYARQMYKAQTQPTGARRPYNPRRAKRKRKLYRDRHAAMCKDPELAAELEFFEAAGHHAVSSDESDVDEVDIGRSDRSSASRTFTRVKLLWRSELLRSLHYRADESSARSLQSRVAVKKRNGAPPRRRIDPIVDNYNPTAIAPPGLSRDSYNSGWLESLDESELNDLKIA